MLSVYFANEENNVSSWGIIEWLDAFIGFEDSYPILYPLWFIRDLFILNLCANVIKWIVDKFPKTVAIALVAIWLFLGGKHIFFQAICFWGIGCFIVNRKIKLSVVDNIKSIFLWIIYIAFIAIDVWARNYSWHGIFHRINLLLGIIFWYACMTKFCNYKINKLLIWLSTYSFSIYLFHEMSLSILKKLCAKFLPMTAEFILIEYLFIPIIILTGCVVISVLMKRVMPGVYGLLTGHRKN